ncbi:GNAT family N-acetyltransferase [Pseudoxanthobacter sp.]|uniref:GNAT family N-acetyltransferase n=1 Tax=Pseudoxanthobacter sp. TaxID=1925742 RepID=UPI002FE28FC0
MSLVIRRAVAGDEQLVMGFVQALAEYEHLAGEVAADAAAIGRALFGDNPRVFCEIAEWNGQPAGFALWFYTFSTFVGRHGLYLEDLFVDPALRGRGIGKALLAELARRCVAEELGRLEWSVLDWNAPSIAFYKAQGAQMMDAWTTCRVAGPALARLAAAAATTEGAA